MSKTKVDAKDIKSFEIELKDIALSDREEIMNMIFDTETQKDFSFHLFVIRKGTDWTDEEINKYSDIEIYAISNKIMEVMSKKK